MVREIDGLSFTAHALVNESRGHGSFARHLDGGHAAAEGVSVGLLAHHT